jgi:pimeloyl-CoA synthetase
VVGEIFFSQRDNIFRIFKCSLKYFVKELANQTKRRNEGASDHAQINFEEVVESYQYDSMFQFVYTIQNLEDTVYIEDIAN